MKRRILNNQLIAASITGIACAALHVSPAWSGPPDSSESAPRSKESRSADWREEIRGVRELQRDVFKEIELDEEQSGAIKALFDSHLNEVKEIIRASVEERKANAGRLRELREQLGDAKKDRDVTRIREIRTEMRALDTRALQLRRAYRGFDDKVIAVLTPDQASAYRRLAVSHRHRATPAAQAVSDLGRVHRILQELDLSTAQEKEVRKALANMSRGFATAHDAEGRVGVVAEFREQALEVLTDQQRETFLRKEREYDGGRAKRDAEGKRGDR